jgi:hypothetical protein
MLLKSVLQLALAVLFRLDLLLYVDDCLFGVSLVLLERSEARRQRAESILYSVNPKIICLNLEESGNVGVHVGSSSVISGIVQTTAIGVLQAR